MNKVPETTLREDLIRVEYTITLTASHDAVHELRALLKFARRRGLKCTRIVHSRPQPQLAAGDDAVTPSPPQATA